MKTVVWLAIMKSNFTFWVATRPYCGACGLNDCGVLDHANDLRWMAKSGGTVASDTVQSYAVLKLAMAKGWDVRSIKPAENDQ